MPRKKSKNNVEIVQNLIGNLEQIIRGKSDEIRLLITGLLGQGHVLIEDVPGVGKTTLAKALALSISGTYKRIQFTPDLLPSDIIGTNIFNPQQASFEFKNGPIFANILLADEVNRASPRTQSSLLEGMNESQVTVDGIKYPLPKVFCTLATQNPIEYHGTYPLPEAQLDRFALRLEIGYPDPKTEIGILLDSEGASNFDKIKPQATIKEILSIQESVNQIKVDRAIAGYIVEIVTRTRNHSALRLGISPRGSLILYRIIKAHAFLQGRDYVIPDDVKDLLIPVCAHRIVLDTKSKYAGVQKKDILQKLLNEVPVPI